MIRGLRFRRQHEHQLTGLTMGTAYSVKLLSGRTQPDLPALQGQIDAELADLVRHMSVHHPDSELSRFNRHADSTPFVMSEPMFHVFECACEIGAESRGSFDITVAPVVDLYGFGSGPFPASLPEESVLQQMRDRVGYHLLELDRANRTVRKKRPDVQCDLSGIAKGYAVDHIGQLLSERGFRDWMVEIGGEVRVRGRNLAGQPWRIAIERPLADQREVHRVIGLRDQAVATSGNYRVGYARESKWISHTIDPRTARPVENSLASVTVVAGDCESADAWASALMVLGPNEGLELACEKHIPALMLLRRPDQSVEEKTTPEFLKLTT